MPIPDHVQISYSSDEDARKAYTRQAAEDWHEFVAFRGRELAPGGRLVVLTVGHEPDGGSGFRAAFDAIVTTLPALVDDGHITAGEARRMSIPSVGRDEKAFRAPFAPSGRFEGLSIEHLEMFNAEDRFWSQYQHDSDAAAFGANWAAFLRASVFPTLAGALECGIADDRAQQFVERLEAAVAEHLAAAPEQMTIPLAKLVLVKKTGSA